jgi:hypothetical protein
MVNVVSMKRRDKNGDQIRKPYVLGAGSKAETSLNAGYLERWRTQPAVMPIGTSKTCQYIGGDFSPAGRMQDQPMCGDPSIEGFSYCQDHHDLCYREPKVFRPMGERAASFTPPGKGFKL